MIEIARAYHKTKFIWKFSCKTLPKKIKEDSQVMWQADAWLASAWLEENLTHKSKQDFH